MKKPEFLRMRHPTVYKGFDALWHVDIWITDKYVQTFGPFKDEAAAEQFAQKT